MRRLARRYLLASAATATGTFPCSPAHPRSSKGQSGKRVAHRERKLLFEKTFARERGDLRAVLSKMLSYPKKFQRNSLVINDESSKTNRSAKSILHV